METSIDLVANKEEVKQQLERRLYLVACYQPSDVIHAMQQMYLKLKVDYGERPLTFNKGQRSIIGVNFTILFRTEYQLGANTDGFVFYGVAKNSKFSAWANSVANQCYRMHLENTKSFYGINDRDGLLRMYLERGQ